MEDLIRREEMVGGEACRDLGVAWIKRVRQFALMPKLKESSRQ